MIKLIVSDMDGTLLNSNNEIPRENIEAIKKAQKVGVNFAIATGRIYSDVEPFLTENKIECECILMNGAEYRNKNGEVLESIEIDKNKMRNIFNVVRNSEFLGEMYTDKGVYTADIKEKALIHSVYRVQALYPGTNFEEALKIVKKLNHFKDLKYITEINDFFNSDIKIGKYIAFYNDEKISQQMKRKLEFIYGLTITSNCTKSIEINNVNAQKGLILAKVAQKMGLKKDEIMVIGDSFNDYSMLSEFPISFAMENAEPEIKKIAQYITDTNNNSGVAKAINKVLNL